MEKIIIINAQNFQLIEELAPLFLTHISEEDEPYDENKINNLNQRYIINMLSQLHGIQLKLIEKGDFRLTFKYRINSCLRDKESNSCLRDEEMMRVIVQYKGKIILIYTKNDINLLETLINCQQVQEAISLVNEYEKTRLSLNEDELEVNWLEVEQF